MTNLNTGLINKISQQVAQKRLATHLANMDEEDRNVAISIMQAEKDAKEGVPGAKERLEAIVAERTASKKTAAV